MSLLLEYIENNPKETKRLVLIMRSYNYLLKLKLCIMKNKIEAAKFRLNSKGAGCKPKLFSLQMLLTLVYLSQHTFQYLGVQFGVSESTNNIFHYWLDIFTELLPASLLEQVKKNPVILNGFSKYSPSIR